MDTTKTSTTPKTRALRAKIAGAAIGLLVGGLISFAFESLPHALGAATHSLKPTIPRAMPCDDFQSLGEPIADQGKASIVSLDTDARLALRIDHHDGAATYEDLSLDRHSKLKNVWVGPEHMVEFTEIRGRAPSASIVLMRDPVVHARCGTAI